MIIMVCGLLLVNLLEFFFFAGVVIITEATILLSQEVIATRPTAEKNVGATGNYWLSTLSSCYDGVINSFGLSIYPCIHHICSLLSQKGSAFHYKTGLSHATLSNL